LIDKLPPFHALSTHTTAIQAAITPQVEALWDARDDAFLQLHIATATWGLDYWETALGIATDVEKSYAVRRAQIKRKILERDTSTVAEVERIAGELADDTATVVEYPSEFWFDIEFDDGEPENLSEIEAEIEDMKPAHLAYPEPSFWFPQMYGVSFYGYGYFGGYDNG